MIPCLFWGYKSRKSAKSAKKGPPEFVFCSVCRRQDLCRQASVFEMDAYAIRSLSWEYRIVSHNSFIFVCSRNNNGKILMKPTRIIEICANSHKAVWKQKPEVQNVWNFVPASRKCERHPATGRSGRRRHSLRLLI